MSSEETPHETTTRLALKAARGEALTEQDERELEAARAEIMDTPIIRDFEAAMWDGMLREAGDLQAKLQDAIRSIEADIAAIEAREAAQP